MAVCVHIWIMSAGEGALILEKSTGRYNQSILKEINPEYSLEGMMLMLQYIGHLMQGAYSFEKTLMLGKNEGRRGRE